MSRWFNSVIRMSFPRLCSVICVLQFLIPISLHFCYHVREFYESTWNIYFHETFFRPLTQRLTNMKVKNFESSIQGFVKENFTLVLQQHIIYIFICKSFLVQARQVHRKQTKINHLLRNTEHHKWFVNLVVYMNKVKY